MIWELASTPLSLISSYAITVDLHVVEKGDPYLGASWSKWVLLGLRFPCDSLFHLPLDHQSEARLDFTKKVITMMEFKQGEEAVMVIPGERWTQDI